MRTVLLALLFLTVLAENTLSAPAGLAARIASLVERHRGDVAVAIKHVITGEKYLYRENEPMPAASLIFYPVMIAAYRQADEGKIDLGTPLTLRDTDKVSGSGVLTEHFSDGARFSIRDAIRIMIAYSDNTAANLVLDSIGIASTGRAMAAFGCPETRIHSKARRRDTSIAPERSAKYGLASTTAAEVLKLFELVERRELIGEKASEKMLGHLFACGDRSKMARLLPSTARLAHMTGAVAAARCDAGVVESPGGSFVVCVLTTANEDRRWTEDNAADRLCAEIARAAYDHFGGRAAAGPAPTLELGDEGPLVEDLQRTLNDRLSPPPNLTIDGEFGPRTETVVIRFQKSVKIVPTGVVGEETWKLLGAIVTQDPPVESPEVVNARALAKEPPDTSEGPPFVTCESWAIGDAKSGELLWGAAADQATDMASTTKVMTALVVLRLAREDGAILDETVTFSKRADDTPGSTCGIRAGESAPVQEVLFALLLPSGNDAAVALAENFGSRVLVGKPEPVDLLARFVVAMNQTSAKLGLTETSFSNPHGLTAKGHRSSARDLLRLAAHALSNKRFREYVSTRERGCRVTAPGGATRDVVWKNTNRLLRIEGYGGVKTGTTRAAGACLIAHGRRGDDELIVVVLGSAASPSRYADTRNLFRWAWKQRGRK